MIILLGILFLAGMALAAYALFSPTTSDTQASPRKKEIRDVKAQEEFSKEQKILRLQGEIDSLSAELEKVRTDYTNIQKELEEAKNKEAGFQEELNRRQDWVKKSEEDLKKVKERRLELEKQFIDKEKQLQEEFNKSVNLDRQLREARERAQLLDKENKEKADQIESLKHQIEGYIKEAQRYMQLAAELKKKEETSVWVPKSEFNKLNEEYTELEKELEGKEARIKKLSEEIIQLNNQLKQRENKPPEA